MEEQEQELEQELEQEQEQPQVDLIYKVDDRPPFGEALFAAFQHLLAIFVAIITPALIICGALAKNVETTGYLVSMSLFVSGLATFIQCKRFGRVGCGLLCVQGTSFSFISPIIAIAAIGGMPLVFGSCIAAAPVEILVSFTFKYLRRVITPLVSGIVVMLIGLSLIKAGFNSCAGGDRFADDFGSAQNLGVAAVVLFCVIIFNNFKNKYVRMSSIFIALIIGYALAACLGMVDFSAFSESKYGWFYLPVPFKEGVKFNISAIIALGLVYLVTAIEATGDVTANSMISGLSIKDDDYSKRVSGGVLADGINSMLAGMFSSFPNSIFAQNNGIIQITGVASRYVGYFVAAMLVILGLFPAIGIVFSIMPAPVLGGATLLMFGTVAAAGVKILSAQTLDRSDVLIIAASLAAGMGVELAPDVLQHAPDDVRMIFSSGITTGGLVAILLNSAMVLFAGKNKGIKIK